MSLSPRTWVALAAAFVIVTLLLTLTAVTLISQREKTVLLNKQIATLITEATVVLHGVAPVLNAVPAHSSTIKGRANALAHLVSQAGPLVGQLNATGMPGTLAETGQLVYSLQQHGRLTSALDNVSALASSANRAALVTRLGQLLDELPAASALIAQFRGLVSGVEHFHLVSGAARGLADLRTLVRVQTRALHVAGATLDNGRGTRIIAGRTLATARSTLATAQQILRIAVQTLAHTASLDRKVGPVP